MLYINLSNLVIILITIILMICYTISFYLYKDFHMNKLFFFYNIFLFRYALLIIFTKSSILNMKTLSTEGIVIFGAFLITLCLWKTVKNRS